MKRGSAITIPCFMLSPDLPTDIFNEFLNENL